MANLEFSLRSKIVLVLTIAVVVFVVVDNSVYQLAMGPKYVELDRTGARDLALKGTKLVESAPVIDRTCRDLSVSLAAKGVWEELLSGEDSAATAGLRDADADVVCLVDGDGHVIWHSVRSLEGRPTALRDFPNEYFAPNHALLRESALDLDAISGLLATEGGPILVSSRPVNVPGPEDDSYRRKPRLILGSFLTDAVMSRLEARLGAGYDLLHLPASKEEIGDEALYDSLTSMSTEQVFVEEGVKLSTYALVKDLRHFPVMALKSQTDSLWKLRLRHSLLSAIAIILIFPFVLLRLLQLIVIGPLLRLTEHALEIGQSDDMTAKLQMTRRDEIGALSQEFDRMMDKLGKSRQENESIARQAGMSQLSSGVLHNVGNVLNSVNISALIALESVKKIDHEGLHVVAERIEENEGQLDDYLANDDQGQHMVSYTRTLAKALASSRDGSVKELHSLMDGLEHIAAVVASLQEYDARVGTKDQISLTSQLDAALTLCLGGDESASSIEVVREFEPLPTVLVDRHQLTEILVNLIQNALQAMAGYDRNPARLTLRTFLQGIDSVVIEVEDTGPGVPLEYRERIFNQGYTSKPDGLGIGLHFCANAARAMNAELLVESGQSGAKFSLKIPLDPETAASVA